MFDDLILAFLYRLLYTFYFEVSDLRKYLDGRVATRAPSGTSHGHVPD